MTDTIKISRKLLERAATLLQDSLHPPAGCDSFDDWTAQGNALAAELRALLATPPADAADMGGQAGEEVEVMAYAVDHPEAGYKVYKQFSQWMNGGEWRCDSLMTVAQHQRIVAALSAQQSAHVSVPRELLERTICRLTHGHEHDKAVRELRALLNGGDEGGQDE